MAVDHLAAGTQDFDIGHSLEDVVFGDLVLGVGSIEDFEEFRYLDEASVEVFGLLADPQNLGGDLGIEVAEHAPHRLLALDGVDIQSIADRDELGPLMLVVSDLLFVLGRVLGHILLELAVYRLHSIQVLVVRRFDHLFFSLLSPSVCETAH